MIDTDKVKLMGLDVAYNLGDLSGIEVHSTTYDLSDADILELWEGAVRWRMAEGAVIVSELPIGDSIVRPIEKHTVPLRFSLPDIKTAIEPYTWTVDGDRGVRSEARDEWKRAPLEAEFALDPSGGRPLINAGALSRKRLAFRYRDNGAKFFLKFRNRNAV